jgi:Na+-translocating ferredoxin:NAD+ oxidoreductase subunit D
LPTSWPSYSVTIPRLDAMSGATPLDALKTALKLGEGRTASPRSWPMPHVFGYIAGQGWEWVGPQVTCSAASGCGRKVIGWHVPIGFLAGMPSLSAGLWLWNPAQFANPLFHLFSGGAMLGAFFIVTDPVSGSTTPRGKLIFGFSAGLLAY